MDMNVIEQKDAKLLNRKEYLFKLTWNGPMPSRKEVREKAIALLNSKPETTLIKAIRTSFGKSEGKVVIYVYNDEETMKKVEPKYVLKRNGLLNENKEEVKQ